MMETWGWILLSSLLTRPGPGEQLGGTWPGIEVIWVT